MMIDLLNLLDFNKNRHDTIQDVNLLSFNIRINDVDILTLISENRD